MRLVYKFNTKKMTETKKNSFKTMGFILPGCMFIGMGLGFLLGSVEIGILIGMGTGFLLAGTLSVRKQNNH